MIRLSLHSEPLVEDRDGMPRIGCRTLRIRDQHGRELACEFMAWGQLAPGVAAMTRVYPRKVEVVQYMPTPT